MTDTKIIAMYLPQFHCIPENDEFWGKGFTDWVTVKKAKPLFEGHQQPRVPLNNNYYDLSQKESVKWQCELARKYGVYGFGIYHYWFNNDKNLLTKPAEIIRDNNDIDINYFFIWDNINWKRSWSNVRGNGWSPVQDLEKGKGGPAILIPYILGEKPDWQKHYKELLSYFKDSRYIKIDNKPVFSIINYDENIERMCGCWNELALEDGFDGIFLIFKNSPKVPKNHFRYCYEPHHITWERSNLFQRIKRYANRKIHAKQKIEIYNFHDSWRKLIKYAECCKDEKIFYGSFISYDDTPRRGNQGRIIKGATPESFRDYMSQLLRVTTAQDKEFLFFTAWNEWGEGACLEPDSLDEYSFLVALKNALTD